VDRTAKLYPLGKLPIPHSNPSFQTEWITPQKTAEFVRFSPFAKGTFLLCNDIFPVTLNKKDPLLCFPFIELTPN